MKMLLYVLDPTKQLQTSIHKTLSITISKFQSLFSANYSLSSQTFPAPINKNTPTIWQLGMRIVSLLLSLFRTKSNFDNITCFPIVGTLPCSNQLIIVMYVNESKHQYENVKLTLLYLALIITHDLTCIKVKIS